MYEILGMSVNLDKIINPVADLFIKCSLKLHPNQAIVMIDGGVCSQIHQWRIGEALRQRNVRVEYDISWFDEYGKDINGVFERNFDLLKTFPDLPFKRAGARKIAYFKKHFSYEESDGGFFTDADMPKYFGGYAPSYHKNLPPFDRTIPTSILDAQNLEIATRIRHDAHPIGIHVRRGDMAVSKHYWRVTPVQYFVNAVKYFVKEYPDSTFYFFSDEPQWVMDNILPALKQLENRCYVMTQNGSDKGYMDLALLSYCAHFVASQGSLAHYANMLNHNPDKILIIPEIPGQAEIKIIRNFNNDVALQKSTPL